MPVITAFAFQIVKPLAPDDTDNVTVADVTWPAAKAEPSRFQLNEIGPLAAAGAQFEIEKLSVTWVLPRFLT